MSGKLQNIPSNVSEGVEGTIQLVCKENSAESDTEYASADLN